MSIPPVSDPNGNSPEEDLDGVVLFDPAASPPPDELATPRTRRRRGSILLLIGLPLVAGGLYAAYESGYLEFAGVDPVSTTPPVQPTPEPQDPALEALSRTEIVGRVDSFVVLAVRASGPTGPLADSPVLFELTEGEGELTPETSQTDGRGIARAELSLPSTVGTVVVAARLPGTELSTSFTVNVRAGEAAQIVGLEGDAQEAEVGQLLEEGIVLRVVDAVGNPVPGVDVLFQAEFGAGLVAPERLRTDADGTATARWRLGQEAGVHVLTALVPDLATSVTFTATATARPEVVEGRPVPIEARPVSVVRRDFVIGASHVCALVEGAVNCRGATARGQGAAGSGGLIALATGVSHVCGLRPAGEAVCWGANDGGQLGDGTRTDRGSPVSVRTELLFSTLTAGSTHTCGLAGGGVPICWGQNLNGQVGDGSRIDQLSPRAVGGGLVFTSLVAGWNHTCGVTDNGNAWCWGLNSEGQLGDGSRLDQLTPTLVRGGVESITAGSAHTCGIGAGGVLCWGANRVGQLGDGTTEGRAQPTPVEGLSGRPAQVAAGAVHTCALLLDGSAECWGQNLHGQLGDGTTQNASSPTAVVGGIRFLSIYAGGALTCGISLEGSQYCWGQNLQGQLGDGTRESRSIPTLVQ